MALLSVLQKAQQWLRKTPERALDQAYEAAQMITAIEQEYFGGNPIAATYGNYGQSAQTYFQGELKKYLNLIDLRMTEFRASSTVLRVSDPRLMEIRVTDSPEAGYTVNQIDQAALFFRKLQAIDALLARYRPAPSPPATVVMVKETAATLPPTNRQPSAIAEGTAKGTANGVLPPSPLPPNSRPNPLGAWLNPPSPLAPRANGATPPPPDSRSVGLSDRANVLPRSILRTVDRIRQDLDPQAEEQVVREFRASRDKTTIAIRFLLLLIIVPLLTQQFTKSFIVGPLVDNFRHTTNAGIFLNLEMEEEALHELQQFEERLRFEVLIGKVPPMPELEIETTVQDKAREIEETYRVRSGDAVKNVFADLLAMGAFIALLTRCQREITALKLFIDEIIYGLSDSAKAFVIILFTDIFVGFHSPHGWEVLLEGLSRHLGFAANREFIFLFIATFPVILDTVFKYWIFRYLNRISPSAVATYKNMNE